VRVLETPSSVQFVGDHLLFVRNRSLLAQPFDLSAMAVSGEATTIVDDVDRINRNWQYAFSASEAGVLVYRTTGLQPVRQFVWVDRTGRELSRLPMTGAIDSPELSPDGKRLAFSMDSSGNRDIHVLDLELPVPTKLTFDSEDDTYPLWSPDGSRIAFSRGRSGSKGIFEVSAVGQDSERKLSPPDNDTGGEYPHSYTNDGRTLLVTKFPAGGVVNGGLFTLSLDREPRLVEFLDTPTDELHPRLSRDNRWVSYLSLAKGDWQVYVNATLLAAGRPKWRIELSAPQNGAPTVMSCSMWGVTTT
jgi:dipeptidyl aminopeptidase/acylaminoacyl peptidase